MRPRIGDCSRARCVPRCGAKRVFLAALGERHDRRDQRQIRRGERKIAGRTNRSAPLGATDGAPCLSNGPVLGRRWLCRGLRSADPVPRSHSIAIRGFAFDATLARLVRETGSQPYFCTLHPSMRGTIEVR